MNKKTQSSLLIIIALLIILMTELIEINSNIVDYYRIIILIPALYYFVNKLKDKTDLKTAIIIAIVLVAVTIGLTYLLGFKFNDILAISLFIIGMNVNKIEHLGFNNDCIKKFIIYYAVPYIILYLLTLVYQKIVGEFSGSYKSVAVPLFQTAAGIIMLIVRTNFSLILFIITFRDFIDSKISININNILIFIAFMVITIVLLVIKNIYLVNGINEIDEKLKRIDAVMESREIKEFKALDLYPEFQTDTDYNIRQEMMKEMGNYNKMLLVVDNYYNESNYKLEKANLDAKYKRNTIAYYAIRDYSALITKYSENFAITKDNAKMQRVSHFVIYFINLACFFVVYQLIKKENKKKYDLMKKEEELASIERMKRLQMEAINRAKEKEKEKEKEEAEKGDYGGYIF